ncbi:hypothetical protein B0H14DRAFT_3875577 [Mycena olivaceomarginata]|nr:hypothetical protein B0H14DRAFT_3891069 [Mycena olivaceomarginata]KAJ7822524.1 hypothetical protein B0H14DRAFT_3875577 [Mycena olivaceomarginata]
MNLRFQASNSTSGKHRVLVVRAGCAEGGVGADLADINVETGGLDEEAHFVRQLLSLTTKDRLQDGAKQCSSIFVNDIYKVMAAWGSAGSIDPFTEIYKLVFQMTGVSRLQRARRRSRRGFLSLESVLATREGDDPPSTQRAVPSSDAFDVLISQGTPTEAIVGFVLRTIFAGVINTGMNASWALLYTSMNTEWKAKATAEIRALLSKHSASNTDALHTRLASIPLAAWEDELPRSTLSLAQRRTGGGCRDPGAGDFLAYPLADVHLDPAIYPDPLRFDLGVGLRCAAPCAGMKVAKLEMKLVLAFLAGFEYQVVDLVGRSVSAVCSTADPQE